MNICSSPFIRINRFILVQEDRYIVYCLKKAIEKAFRIDYYIGNFFKYFYSVCYYVSDPCVLNKNLRHNSQTQVTYKCKILIRAKA